MDVYVYFIIKCFLTIFLYIIPVISYVFVRYFYEINQHVKIIIDNGLIFSFTTLTFITNTLAFIDYTIRLIFGFISFENPLLYVYRKTVEIPAIWLTSIII